MPSFKALIALVALGSPSAFANSMAPEIAAETQSYWGNDAQLEQYQQNLKALEAIEESSPAVAPANSRNQCAAVKDKRLARKRLWDDANTASQIDSDPKRAAWRKRVIVESRTGAVDLQRIREREMDLIWREFRLALRSPNFAWNQKAAAQEMLAHMTAVINRLAQPARAYTTWNGVGVNPSLYTFKSWYSSMVLDRVRDLVAKVGTAAGSPAMADQLHEIATATYPLYFSESATPLTGFEARGLLYYALPLATRKRLVSELHIRFDIRDVASNSTPGLANTPFTRLDGLCAANAYDCSLLTDAYLYGAMLPSMDGLMGGFPSNPRLTKGNGIDCSTWVQWNYLKAGIGERAFPFRITTGAMIADPELTDNSEVVEACQKTGQCDPFFRTEPIKSEWDLVPGDAIVYTGHTRIFLGYNDAGDFLVSEAVGGRRRAVVESAVNVYADGKCVTPFTGGKKHYRMFPVKPLN